MTLKLAIATIAGAAIFPFLIRMVWGRLVDKFGAIGGWMAAGILVGTTWCLNHGINMIHQTGRAWIDMAWAAAVGLITATYMHGGSIKKSSETIVGAVIGGIIGGFLLSCFLA
ncbi:Lin0368 family putative glycerol transporter subunit [uncultured Clostridium sp.]|uniref:Lin0368 family putative glycerol transporter subunit n=1 Tax=uncultured Clostridium sp. TaxID=59620 RepID=UPI0028EBD145|nr:hypothetical protein [uncultured Clostridium sp.]